MKTLEHLGIDGGERLVQRRKIALPWIWKRRKRGGGKPDHLGLIITRCHERHSSDVVRKCA